MYETVECCQHSLTFWNEFLQGQIISLKIYEQKSFVKSVEIGLYQVQSKILLNEVNFAAHNCKIK